MPFAAHVVPGAAQVKHVKLVVLAWLVARAAAVVHGCAAHAAGVLRVFAGTAAAVGHEAAARFVLDGPEAHHP